MDTHAAQVGGGGQGDDPPKRKIPGGLGQTSEDFLPTWVRAIFIAILQRLLQLLGPAPEGPLAGQVNDFFSNAPQVPVAAGSQSARARQPSETSPQVVVASAREQDISPAASGSQAALSDGERPRYFAVYWGTQVGVFVGW